MKYVYIPTHYNGEINLPDDFIASLPSKIILAGVVQWVKHIPEIKRQLEQHDKQVTLFKSVHGTQLGQILGCDVFPQTKEYDAFLFIGDGLFHPTALLYSNTKPVYMYNPITKQGSTLSEDYLKKLATKRKALLSKFLGATRIGIIVTTKGGQNNIVGAQQLSKKLKEKHKKPYIFLADTINLLELENFPFIESWVNTACPRIQEDHNVKVLNIRDAWKVV